MTYARFQNDTVTERSAELPPKVWVQETVDPPTGRYEPLTVANAASFDWYEVVRVAKPADTATTTHDRSVAVVDGKLSDVWTERPKTQTELDADADQTQRDQVAAGVADITAYLALESPTNAEVVAQVELLSRAVRRLAKDQYGG